MHSLTDNRTAQPRARGPATVRRRGAFTLTELLVVIAIIAVLASLTSVGVMRAMDTARQATIKTELDQIDMALKSYREKYGSYPPCDLRNPASNAVLRSHVARVFPRYNLNNLPGDLAAAGVDTANFRPDQALVFWLQGFSPDPANPFITPGRLQIVAGSASGNAMAITPLFSFDATRLFQVPSTAPYTPVISPTGTVVASYFPKGIVPPSTKAAPYVYFDSSTYGSPPVLNNTEALPNAFNTTLATQTTSNSSPIPFSNAGAAVPYWSDINLNSHTNLPADANETWASPDSFQLIGAGMDGMYGANLVNFRAYPTGALTYDTSNNLADDDNLTNFCNKARLGDAKP